VVDGSSKSFCDNSLEYVCKKVHPCPDGVVVDGSSKSFCDNSLEYVCKKVHPCPDGEIGRRKGLKIPRWKHCAGSTPAPGTILLYIPVSIYLQLSLKAFNLKATTAIPVSACLLLSYIK
jgi:hypothetical protein